MTVKPGIPIYTGKDQELVRALDAMRFNIELLTGARGDSLTLLPINATSPQVIQAINQIIERLSP